MPHALAGALGTLAYDRTAVARMGLAARALAAGRYRKERLVNDVDCFISRITRPQEKSMNVLITGGAGFIGSHLAERCLAEGWQVAVLDDLSTGAFSNIAHLKAKPAFSYAH